MILGFCTNRYKNPVYVRLYPVQERKIPVLVQAQERKIPVLFSQDE